MRFMPNDCVLDHQCCIHAPGIQFNPGYQTGRLSAAIMVLLYLNPIIPALNPQDCEPPAADELANMSNNG